MFLIDLEFRALRRISSLPPWHGARWSAWLRLACRQRGFRLEDLALAILPLRHGIEPIRAGEMLTLRLLLKADGLPLLPALTGALAETGGGGEFSADSLVPCLARDGTGARILWAGRGSGWLKPASFSQETLLPAICALREMEEWSLHFAGPLRLPLPPKDAQRGGGVAKFARPDDLLAEKGLDNLLARVRFMGAESLLPLEATPLWARLRWEDLRYSRDRKIALGGIAGVCRWCGKPDFAQARRLVLGQYLGAGKNARFGLGFWNIPELGSVAHAMA